MNPIEKYNSARKDLTIDGELKNEILRKDWENKLDNLLNSPITLHLLSMKTKFPISYIQYWGPKRLFPTKNPWDKI